LMARKTEGGGSDGRQYHGAAEPAL
jgi:hypothetical protein